MKLFAATITICDLCAHLLFWIIRMRSVSLVHLVVGSVSLSCSSAVCERCRSAFCAAGCGADIEDGAVLDKAEDNLQPRRR